jgi:argininosuccinate lyase
VKDNILADKKYDYLFTVDSLNEMVVVEFLLEMLISRYEQLENGTFQSLKKPLYP